MLMRESDELKIQKCVDNELSSQETSELLQRLDSLTDGWKTLACGLLEDRRIRSVLPSSKSATAKPLMTPPVIMQPAKFSSPMTSSPSLSSDNTKPLLSKAADEPRIIKVNDVVRHWWSHPVTSLTLCAAIAFVGGLLIPDIKDGKSTGGNSLSGVPSPTRSAQYPLAATAGNQQYKVELQPGGRPVEIPVVTDLKELHDLDRHHPIFSRPNNGSQNVQWMVVPVEGNKSMLIPVSEDASADMQ
jgi:hypothetical protein